MPSLQEHMLRVAAVARLICENLEVPVDKENIIAACLLHDMGNIIKFKLGAFPEFLEPEGLEYWENTQKKFKERYGDSEYLASLKISQEIDVNKRTLELIEAISFVGVLKNALSYDFGKKIVEYCDDRVVPSGVVGLEERFMDLRTRYTHRRKDPSEREAFENAVRKMEKQIFAKCKIKPEDINNETVAPIISELRNFMIK
ncbi:MAG: Metal dependent phosphohydrolase [Candidatus Yanofskybacteria bacterium GW2011_GWC2_37_9]|uniref:Metal dependent phosphohydrolase n=1 Tax=Candidatus Yanofskybacteria bacterium GW2011_GWC2_37_9 TaxID=1619028 RepID=A0A0G0HUX7_9BACT|nr:MAG: Metal dependent phosphohydrolase [Candidatus Yanofskybacteria bacterium GW2011_GWC2_37_9]